MRILVALTGLSGLLAVGLGAFGAHALQARLRAEGLALYRTAGAYQMAHTLATLAAAALATVGLAVPVLALAAGWCFLGGVALFSGSLYALALGAPRRLATLTPIGGLAFLAGWTLLTIAALRHA